MDAGRWERLKALFDAAAACPPDERAAALARACDDPELCAEALALLAANDDAPDFLERPVRTEALRVATGAADEDLSGRRIGPYRLVRVLGQGGMGTVYLAERADGQFRQQVAVKLVRQRMQRDDLLLRLRRERQILASLQHPHIARLLDGGVTEDGWPYLVMEYVDGHEIDTYCERHQLPVGQRLALFQTVCAAVQHAHHNLIVHRDLKPSNILVTAEGEVKLLDFGIAKLLSDDATGDPADEVVTHPGARVMTLAYASPEQVRGQPVTTASDVYALGVVLYQLLTGLRPYELHGLSPVEVERVICEREPPRPSAVAPRDARLRRQLRGDLDNIVMQALRKEPSRRYRSVEPFTEDLRRHLAELPVTARPDTVGYRMAKFTRRHRAGVVAAVVAGVALLGGVAAIAHQARVAAAERDRAGRRFDDVRALANTMLFELHDTIRDLPGATPARQMMVSQALRYLHTLADAAVEPAFQLELAEAYQRVGEIQGDPHYPNLGDLTGATESYRNALALREAFFERYPHDPAARRAVANSYGRLAVVRSWGGDNEQAIQLSTRALALLEPLTAAAPADAGLRHDAARIRSELGWWLIWAGRIEDGLAHLTAAQDVLEALGRSQPEHLDLQLDLWRAYSFQCDGLQFRGDFAGALRLLQTRGLPHLERLRQRHARNPRVLYSLRTCHHFIGVSYQELGRLPEALAAFQTSLALAERLIAADSTDSKGYRGAASEHLALGELLARLDRPAEAVASLEQSLRLRAQLYAQDPQNAEAGNVVATTHSTLCRVQLRLGRLETALRHCREAAAIQESVVATDPGNAVGQEHLGVAHALTARVYRAMAARPGPAETRRRLAHDALEAYAKALTILESLQAMGVSFAWTIHPDTLLAERTALARVAAAAPPPG